MATKSTNSLINKSKSVNKNSEKGLFDFLKSANDYLETVPRRANSAFENAIGNGERLTQSKVDVICAWLAWRINVSIEYLRQAIIKGLYGLYKSTVAGQVMQCANMIKNFVRDPLRQLGRFAGTIFGPVGTVLSYSAKMTAEVARLGGNLASIASSLPPNPPSPNINYNKFKLKVKTISMSDIKSDPSNLPAPEVMFPEPERPFSKETFTKTFETDSAKLKSGKVKYKLKEQDKKALESLNMSLA